MTDELNTRPTPTERSTKSAPDFLPSHLHEERLPSSDAAGFGADTERPVLQVREALIEKLGKHAECFMPCACHESNGSPCAKLADEIIALVTARPSDAAVALPRFVAGRSDNDNPRMSVLIFGEPLTAEHHGEIARRVAALAIPHEEAVREQTIEECAKIAEAEAERILSKQSPTTDPLSMMDTVNLNLRMMACALPEVAKSIRALSPTVASERVSERETMSARADDPSL